MLIEGTLKKWNDDKGFGFITPAQGGPEVFVHISAFPRNSSRPLLGERVTFEIEIDKQGKKRAKNLVFLDRVKPASKKHTIVHRKNNPNSISLLSVVIIGFLIAVGAYMYNHINVSSTLQGIASETNTSVKFSNQTIFNTFKCDGRTHCSQMTSCAEAEYFLKNCPNVEMDGNNDGEPCEQQWCTSSFAN